MKPYTICHMMTSLDGRIDCAMTVKLKGGDEYYQTLNDLHTDGNVCGRVTAETEMANGIYEVNNYSAFGKEDYYLDHKANYYDIIIDTKGSLEWDEDADIIVITSEKVGNEYLEYLKNQHISYIVTGKDKIDLNRASELLYEYFDIKRMAIVGGGNINGAYLVNGLLDEISIVLGPGIDGRKNEVSLFDGLDKDKEPTNLKLIDLKKYENDVIYLRYKLED